ncbi:Retrovirus-related Pol polyprotein [Labeo rohita]|uniref:Retrovirus-related Pol polyprotein n=1 Tax=Labeo rohita TaxID=84645 RepID=A0ABQ8L4A4_LABRO|nr:Retrovirus-related Pol polyprotein [Labeo rohita]
MLRTLADKGKERWKEHLPQVVHAYNCTRHESTGYSPFYLLYGRNSHLPVDLIFGLVEKADEVTHKGGKEQYDRKTRGVILKPGDRVLVRNLGGQGGPGKLRSYWEKEVYVVKKQVSDNPVYVVCPENGGNRKTRTLHRNLLLLVNDLPVEAPPKSPCSKKPAKEKETQMQTNKDSKDKKRRNYIRDSDTTDSDEDGDLGGYCLRVPVSLTEPERDDPPERASANEQFGQVQRRDSQNQMMKTMQKVYTQQTCPFGARVGQKSNPRGQPAVGPDTGVKCGARVGPTLWGPCGAGVGQPKSVG